MKKIYRLLAGWLLIISILSCDSLNQITGTEIFTEKPANRIEENFGEDWQFQRVTESGEDPGWKEVTIPHTVRIEPLVVNDQWQGRSIYLKSFEVDNLTNRKWFFHFEGVMQEAIVTINGIPAASHKGGYLPFTIDATPFLEEGADNNIQVEVLNNDDPTIPPGKPLADLDFNYYGGIYRNVRLIKTNEVYITDAVHADKVNSGGILVHFNAADAESATGILKAQVRNETDSRKRIEVRTTFSASGRSRVFTSSGDVLEPGEDKAFTNNIVLRNPLLWSPSNPNLYEVTVEVLADAKVVDSKVLRTGIRDIELAGNAFYLNGKKFFINGTNRHQEYPYIGYALSDEAQYRDAYKIKEAGFDLVRLSHYPQSTAFLEACDELGLMVMNAIPGWQYYEEGEFVENAIQDIQDMVRRDRNHPSVVFWENSLNESRMTEEFMIRANKVLKAELPYDDIYTAGWIDHPSYDLFIPARQHAKPPAYWNNYNKPNRPVFIAEYGDWEYYAQNAGFNQKEFSDLKEEERSSRQLRSAGEAALLQQALNFQEAFNSNLKGEQTVGQANWLMFDYNRGYSDDLEASGIADIFRIPKFSFFFYKSQKSPYADKFSQPMVFIASYWTPNSTTSVKVFSNTEEVALYLNEELVEKKQPERNQLSDELPYPPFVFEIENFEQGELRAVGYIGGEEVASHKVRTPGPPAKIELVIDHSGKSLATETPDMVFVYAIIRDENGTAVPNAENVVQFTLDGDTEKVELIGENPVAAEAGIATILLKTESFSDPVTIKATSEDLEGAEITIQDQ